MENDLGNLLKIIKHAITITYYHDLKYLFVCSIVAGTQSWRRDVKYIQHNKMKSDTYMLPHLFC